MNRIVKIGMDVHSTNYTLCAMEPVLDGEDRIFANIQVTPDYKNVLPSALVTPGSEDPQAVMDTRTPRARSALYFLFVICFLSHLDLRLAAARCMDGIKVCGML